MRFYGLVDATRLEAFELHVAREDAERRLAEYLKVAPDWEPLLVIEEIELDGQPGEPCWN
jgi:hypothetical protein